MSIIRAPQPEHFTVVRNTLVDDERLSYRAFGLLVYLLSKPDNWRIEASALARPAGREGRDAVRSALSELEATGHLRREKHQDKHGRWVTDSYIYEIPDVSAGHTGDGIPVVGNPDAGKPGANEKTESKYPPNPPQAGGRRRKRRACNPQAPGPLSDACRHGEGKDCHVRWCNCPHHQRNAA